MDVVSGTSADVNPRKIRGSSTLGQPCPRNHQDDLISPEYLFILRSRWKTLAIGTAVCGVLAVAFSWWARPVYEARSSLLVTESRRSERNTWRPQASVSNVRAMLENQSLAAQLIQEFNLDKPPLDLTPETFVKGPLRLEEAKGTDVIRIRVRLPEPELAARVANRMAGLGVELNRRINQAEAEATRKVIGGELEAARAKLKDLEARLLALREKARVELARKDIESRLGQRGQLLALQIEIETEAARLARAEEEMAKHQRTLTVKRSIDSDSTLTEVARSTGQSRSGVLGLELREELINKVYETLEEQVATSRTKLSAFEGQREELVDKLGEHDIPGLTELYRKESELAKLELERDLARKVYSDLVVRYEQANLEGRGTDLQVIDLAVVPQRPASPRLVVNLAVGLVGGVMLSALVAFLLEHASRGKASRAEA